MKKVKETKKPEEPKVNPEVALLKGQLVRALADYDNLRKRTDEEKITWIKFATQKFIQNLLPVLDSFEAAQNHLKDSGLAIAINQFKEILKDEGLTEIRPKVGEVFDENMMEASEVVEATNDTTLMGKVAEVVMSGWKFVDGIVVRHARVKVFKAEKAS